VSTLLKGSERWLAAKEGKQMKTLLYPSWQKPYQEALLEFDPDNLKEKVLTTETAIFLRFLELARVNGQATDERVALNDALRALRALQVEKLHYPKLPSEFHQNQ
jgi:hypothetical protein